MCTSIDEVHPSEIKCFEFHKFTELNSACEALVCSTSVCQHYLTE